MIPNLIKAKQFVDDNIELATKHGYICPQENCRSYYTKACFLLANFKRVNDVTPSDIIPELIKYIELIMPILKENQK